MEDADALSAWAFLHEELSAQPGVVFDGEMLPTFEFAKPGAVKGPHRPLLLDRPITTRTDNAVTKAAGVFGRYAAVVEIKAENGKTYKRFVTLCRMNAERAHEDSAEDRQQGAPASTGG